MQYIDIQGIQMPRLGLGTFSLNGKACVDGIQDAIAMGYRHIDTAQAYNNEQEVGDGIRASGIGRDALFITTKVWYTHLREKQVLEAVHDSLRKLQTDYVDLLLVHWPNEEVGVEEPLRAMNQLLEEGKTRLIGVSNFTTGMVEQAVKVAPIVCNQVEYHPYLDQRKLMETMRRHDLLLTAYSPIGKGKVVEDEELIAIGEKYGKTAAQVTLRWHLQQEKVAAIPRSSSSERRRENLDVFDFELTEEEMQVFFSKQARERMIDPAWAPAWD